MFEIAGIVCLLLAVSTFSQEQAEHRNFQYNSAIDPLTGRYNFAYDTGNDNDIAHSMHMQYQDADGIVRGRYGYTDPRGKLRMVEYEAGPNGFIARGDVGPDQSLHDNTPLVTADSPLSSYREGDFLLDPAPVQMAGWDPEANPIAQPISEEAGGYAQGEDTASSIPQPESSEETTMSPFDRSLFPTLNITSNNPVTIYESGSDGYDDRYPRIIYTTGENSNEPGIESEAYKENDDSVSELPNDNGLNVNNIDVDPEEIRSSSGSGPVRRSADSSSSSANLQSQQTQSQPVKVTTSDGRRLFYRDSHSMEPHEHYYFSPTHDHNSETNYYRPRQTHDHYSERRYYRPRQTHDHDAERRYYSYRQTHDHDAERRYYRARQTHDHDAEQRYYRARQPHDHDAEPYYYQRIYRNGRIYYRDRHSRVPHAHSSQAYTNHQDHQHSDVHLYARYRNNDYPATAKPRQLQYIPSDKYHDKEYYWTYS